MVSPTEDTGARRVLLRCAIVLGLASIGTVSVLLVQFALGVRSVEYVVIHSAATVLGAVIGTATVYLAHRAWASWRRQSR